MTRVPTSGCLAMPAPVAIVGGTGRLAEAGPSRSFGGVPIFYECQRCTACCRWPGEVQLREGESARLAAFKKMSESEFIGRFTRPSGDRSGLVLREKANGECVFLDGRDCSVQPVKPQQCREFPNLWNFPGFEKLCRAIPRMVSREEREQLIAPATGPCRAGGRTAPASVV